MKKILLLLVVILTAFTACKKGSQTDPHHDSLISLVLKDTLQLYIGEIKNVPVVINPSDYDLDSLRYTSSDTSVLTISNLGVIKAKKVGVSQIKISNYTYTHSVDCKITVVPAPIDSLKLGLIAYYPFNNSTADSSGLGNNGTGYKLLSVADRFGNANSAYHFDGDSSSVVVADNLYLRLYQTDFTQSAWVKLDDYNPSYGCVVLGKRVPGVNDEGYTLSIGGYTTSSGFSTAGILHYGPGGTSVNNVLSTKSIGLNQWHMVTCVYTYLNQTLTMYIDGILDNVTPNIASPNASVGAKLYIGRDDPTLEDNGYFIKGNLDDIRMYDRALAASEIIKLYNLTH